MRRLCALFLLGILAVIIATASASAAKAPGSGEAVKLKPDIVIKDVNITRISVVPEGHNVRINVTAANLVAGTSTGPFKVKVEWTEDPTTGFNLLATGGVANLANNPASVIAYQGKTLSFNQLVPTGKAYKYRITADYLNQVDEANETNNVTSAGYFAVPVAHFGGFTPA